MNVVYRKDEVWLCTGFTAPLQALRIIEITNGFVKHDYGWESSELWHSRAKTKLGTVRRIMGIPFGIKR